MRVYLYVVSIWCLLLSACSTAHDDIDKLFQQHSQLHFNDLVVQVQGYPVPTLDAFMGWVIFNQAEAEYEAIIKQFELSGITHEMPLYLVLLQGTNWRLNGKSAFTIPDKADWPNMINTLLFIESYLLPELGLLVPVSGDRTEEYNMISGGAKSSKHLSFCALDLVPVKTYARKDLHQRLRKIHREVGKQFNIGLGLYSGLRFHIDSCGFRSW
ncbi:MAG: hypothetical protein HRU21_04120 [Pseudomonadales bacterium]|nr:hypothetical protein [Pseudomonadales bacterium]